MEFYDPMEHNCLWCRRPETMKAQAAADMLYEEEEMEEERDRERLMNLYPEIARELMPFVERECDALEYEGSNMFDEFPDRNALSRVTERIYDEVRERYEPAEGDDRDEMMAMNAEMRRRYPPKKNWLSDLIEVLFLDEMFRRRKRRRNYRRR